MKARFSTSSNVLMAAQLKIIAERTQTEGHQRTLSSVQRNTTRATLKGREHTLLEGLDPVMLLPAE